MCISSIKQYLFDGIAAYKSYIVGVKNRLNSLLSKILTTNMS